MISRVARAETKPIWTTSTFLVYTGGLTVLAGGLGALGYLSTQFRGDGQQTAWALLILVVLYTIAHGLLRADRPIAAGIFGFASVIAWAYLVGQAFQWWGWTNGSFNNLREWSWSRLALLVLILIAAHDDRKRFRFPLIRLISAVVFWLLVISVLPDGRNEAYIWTLLVGLLYLFAGSVSDKPSAFWLHLVGGALVGVPILYWCHTTTFDFAVIAFMSLVYVMWSYWTKRSSWAVYGTIGFFIVTSYFLFTSAVSGITTGLLAGRAPNISVWSFPLAFGLLGFWLVMLGMLGRRRRRPAAVVVEQTVVVETPAPPAD
jgi:hypothetical protein